MNLLSVGQDDLSTSEDEEKINKPIVPPRNRLNGSEITVKRHQSIKDKPKTNQRNGISERKKSEDLERTLTNELQDYESLDVTTVQRKLTTFYTTAIFWIYF